MKTLSISDDDCCSTCKLCQYNVGGESSCEKNFPAIFDPDGYAIMCDEYQAIDCDD